MVTAGIFPFKENSHGRAGNRTRDLMVSNQRLWPLNHEAGLCNHCCCGKSISITYSECGYVALGIQHANRMRRHILLSVASLGVPIFFFPHYLINGTIFGNKGIIEHKFCVLFLSSSFISNVSQCKKTRNRYHTSIYSITYSTGYRCRS